jgi:D-alanyl-D-alanine carboxypeptidase (penicillin-binding protein 5/6)
VALYNTYVAQDGSVVPVAAGEQLTEYQMLQAIMLPSANNIADSLAIWAYGSLPAYAAAANAYAAQLGLSSTHIGSDASGLAPDSVSTAHDLVTLGKVAMQHPVLAQIAAQSTVDGFPLVGTIKNVNFLLGNSGVVGIKTGNSDDVGGVFVSAARTTINDRPVTVVTALVGTDNLFSAVQGSLPLIKSAQTNFSASEAIGSGAVVGHYKQPWGGTINAVINHKFSITGWNGGRTSIAINLRPTIAPSADQGDIVGELVANQSAFAGKQTAPVTLSSAPSKAPILWRLTHPW